jgi:hypothetical protein
MCSLYKQRNNQELEEIVSVSCDLSLRLRDETFLNIIGMIPRRNMVSLNICLNTLRIEWDQRAVHYQADVNMQMIAVKTVQGVHPITTIDEVKEDANKKKKKNARVVIDDHPNEGTRTFLPTRPLSKEKAKRTNLDNKGAPVKKAGAKN